MTTPKVYLVRALWAVLDENEAASVIIDRLRAERDEVRAALGEARQWVETNTASVRCLSAAAAVPGEAMLDRIDRALASTKEGSAE